MEKKQNLGIGLIIGLVIGVFAGRFLVVPQQPAPQMVMDHGSMMAPPTSSAMHDTMTNMTAGLQGKEGDAFDKAFLEEMIVHHEGAVAMAKLVLENSNRQELRKLVEAIIAAQTQEIQTMRGWQKQWFK